MLVSPILKMLSLLGVTLTAGLIMGLAGTFLYLNPQVPSAASYREIRLQTPLRIFASDGSFIAEFGERRRIPLSIDAIPELFRRAVLDTEDKRFYSHGGIDYITLVRATLRLLTSPDEIGPGASTITMQVARNVSFSLEQTFIRKFKEMLLAVKIERELSKDEILELYLNLIPFGKRAYGAEAAALTYYGRSLSELTVAQWAMLAGIPQAPSIGNPINGPERALRRRNLVLRNMLDQGSIDQPVYSAAVAAPITASVYERSTELDAPWIAEWAREQTIALYGTGAYEDGLEVWTTVDARAQRAANQAMRAGLEAYDRRHGYRGPERMLLAPDEGPLDDDTLARWRATLAETPLLGEQLPALVTAVDDAGFDALLANGDIVRVPLEAVRWARPFLTVNSMGARPDTPAKVVARGHLVRLRSTEEGWALGQIPDVGGALIALDPDDGAVRAMVGGYDFRRLQFNHALQAARQPGSSFKPFVYAAALDAGRTPASIYLDAPLVFSDANLESLYRPRNDSGDFSGPTRLRRALYRSVNLVSMRVLLDIGAGNVIDHVGRFGFDTRTFPRNLQLAIGGGTMALTPLDMARGFSVFANGGFRVDPYLLTRIERGGSDVLFRASPLVACDANCERNQRVALSGMASIADPADPADRAGASERDGDGNANGAGLAETGSADRDAADSGAGMGTNELQLAPRVLDERTAHLMHSMLGDVIRYGTGRRARSLERNDLGGKTGTTNEADTWFSGYQRELAATVWVGFSDNRPVGDNEFGSTTALPIWIDLMRAALDGVPEHVPEQPPGIVRVRIDPETGLLASPGDPDAIFELFREENVPTTADARPRSEEASPESIF